MFQWLKRFSKKTVPAIKPEPLSRIEFEPLLRAQFERIHNDTFSDEENYDYFLTLTRGNEPQAFFMTVHAVLCSTEVLIKTKEFTPNLRAIFSEHVQNFDYQQVANDVAQWIEGRVSAVEQYIANQEEARRAFIYDRKPEANPNVTSSLMNTVSPADQEAFSKLALNVLHNHRASDWEAAQAFNIELMRMNSNQSEFIRSLQIINESAWIVAFGKKQDTIDSRMLLIEEQMQRLKFSLVTPNAAQMIQDFFYQVQEQHQTSRFLNEAVNIIEKADRLKTASARQKRLDQASNLIRDGLLMNPRNVVLQTALELIPLENIQAVDLVKVAQAISDEKFRQNK